MDASGKLLKQLQQMYKLRADFFKRKWKRVLPLNEMIIDRWEKAEYLEFGKNTSIYDTSLVFGDVRLGQDTWIGPFTILDGSGGLLMGSYCSISAGVQIYTHDTVYWALSGGKQKYTYAPVNIGDCCYIGANTIITKGVSIGSHCMIGANSFVNNDLPNFSVAFGVPVGIVGKVVINRNKEAAIKYFKKPKESKCLCF